MCHRVGPAGPVDLFPLNPKGEGRSLPPGFVNRSSHVQIYLKTHLREDDSGIAADFTERGEKTDLLLGDSLGSLLANTLPHLPSSLATAPCGPCPAPPHAPLALEVCSLAHSSALGCTSPPALRSLYNLSHGKSLKCGDMLSDPVRTDTQHVKYAKICIFSSEMKELAGEKIIL